MPGLFHPVFALVLFLRRVPDGGGGLLMIVVGVGLLLWVVALVTAGVREGTPT